MRFFLLLVLFCVPGFAAEHPGTEEFVKRAVSEYGLPEKEVRALFAKAEYKQSIIDAISRPAEGKPWHEYRPIFLTDKRIDEGVDFWKENRELIASASKKFGVDEEIIVAIIGVETFIWTKYRRLSHHRCACDTGFLLSPGIFLLTGPRFSPASC